MAALAADDPTPIIAAAERGLLDFLNTPTQQILRQLPLQRFPQEAPPADPVRPVRSIPPK
jgi:hypothetical protein